MPFAVVVIADVAEGGGADAGEVGADVTTPVAVAVAADASLFAPSVVPTTDAAVMVVVSVAAVSLDGIVALLAQDVKANLAKTAIMQR